MDANLYCKYHFAMIFLSTIYLSVVVGKDCKFEYPCKCTSENGRSVDLTNAKRPLHAVDPKASYNYDFEPCGDGSLVPKCHDDTAHRNDVIACQYNDNSIYGLGKVKNYTARGDLETEPVTFYFQYQEKDNKIRKAEVEVQCSSSDRFTFVKETQETERIYIYSFILETPAACPSSHSSSGGLSVGSVLVILFFVFILVYLVGGLVFLKFVRRAEGLEAIPNYEFWKEIPGLVKDGVAFTFRGCKVESTYEKI